MSAILAYSVPGLRLLLAGHDRPFRPAPAQDDLLASASAGRFAISARPGAWQAFQLIVDSATDAAVAAVRCDGLLSGDEFTCLATEGVDSAGRAFLQTMHIEGGKPWPLWCLVRLGSAGRRTLTLDVAIDGDVHPVEMEVSAFGDYDLDAGTTDRDSLARLSWLDSRRGISDDIPAPFTAIERDGMWLSILGRDIELGADGCPAQVYTHFAGNNSVLTDDARPILAAPTRFAVLRDGAEVKLLPGRMAFTCVKPDCVRWSAESAGQGVRMRVEGALEFDGTLTLNAYLRADEAAQYDVELRHAPAEGYDGMFIGLGVNGGKTPAAHSWKWDSQKRQDACWIGGVNGGMVIRPRDPDMPQPLVNIYFHHGPGNLPVNWVNGGAGGFELKDGALRYYSGSIELAGTEKLFGVELMISPFKTVDQRTHFATRYYHGGPYKEDRWASHAHESGCTHINYHHGNDGYPFINYPMYDDRTFHRLIAEAHSYGIGVKPYYTVRELTSRLPEFWAFRSLRKEIFAYPAYRFDGIPFQGGVDPFLKENMDGEVVPAWKHVFKDGPYAGVTDPALITNPMSRLANFHVEGLHYMCTKWGIDGIYIDDVGYDRTVMRRVRRVLDAERPGALIDLHCWNHYEDRLGAGWGHNALVYAPLMPYLNSLWIGEGFNYDKTSAEYIMVEISGLPFGLMGEMLQGGGNPWRGMLYGMTSRFMWTEKDPHPIWKLRDEFGFDGVRMTGFWDKGAIGADRDDVKCTVYENAEADRLLICYANFAGEDVSFTPVGLPEGYEVCLPEVEGLQEHAVYDGGAIRLETTGGVILWAQKK